MRRLPILIPHRPGCADFPLPVLHGRASLTEVQMTPSVTCRQRKTRGRTSALVSILASSATRCRFVDRFVRLKVLSRTECFLNASSVAHQAAGRSEFGILVDRGHCVAKCQCCEPFAVAGKECISSDYKRAGPQLD